jgi:mercuric ion transport protein
VKTRRSPSAQSKKFSTPTQPSSTGSKQAFKTGIIGTIITALYCFTPILVILLSAVGLSVIIGLLDFVLLPALVIFLAITGYGLWKKS